MNRCNAVLCFSAVSLCLLFAPLTRADDPPLKLHWAANYLTISGPEKKIPGGEIKIMYLEAYCRAGSTDRDWKETVIPHKAELVSASENGQEIKLKDTLDDGVIVEHTITSKSDEVDFRLSARNPTDQESGAVWAQPCLRVDRFAGAPNTDFRERVPEYAKKCFVFLDGALTRLPTEPWAEKARYIPGQVYCPKTVDRNDVNPRPLSSLVPSSGLTGCFSGDDSQILAVAWEPYQELFQGVIGCMHSDFRVGGLKPGETKTIRGKLYVLPADVPALVKRYAADFPEQAERK